MRFFRYCAVAKRRTDPGLGSSSEMKMDHHGSLLSIFRFSSLADKLLILLGTVAAIGTGICVPLLTINLAGITHSLMNGGLSQEDIDELICSNETYNNTARSDGTLNNHSEFNNFDNMVEEVRLITMNVLMFAAIKFVCTFLYVACFNTAAENQVHRMRNAFFKAMLHQEIAWHDENKSTTYIARFAEDMKDIQEGIGEKIGMLITALSGYVSGFICAFLHGWKFTLVIAGVAPITSITIWILARLQAKISSTELKAKAEAGGVAQEVFGAIRTVLAFDGQEKETERFRAHSEAAKKIAIKRGIVTACISAVGQGFQFFVFALGFWYGAVLVADFCTPTGYSSLDILIVFFCVLGGTTKMSTITPHLENFTRARSSAAFIFSILDRKSVIDASAETGLFPETFRGHISFTNVHFKYSTRPDVPVLKGVTFEAQPKQTVALVGSSGSGKSTCVQLILRLHDPTNGTICIDGHKLQDLNLKWLRSQIGIVSQEPVLFSGSISDNIRYGRPDVTQEEIEIAARQANAEEFILKLKDKYDTVVGERGARLSGGQKQRIAIARALVRNPSILLLDEATSALDNHSELLVQQALERASNGRTVLVVAHRLSTIRKADVIVVFKDGVVIESGDHKSLIAQRGTYFRMISSQGRRSRNPSKQQSPHLSTLKARHGSKKNQSKRERHLSQSRQNQPENSKPKNDTLKEKKKFKRSLRKQMEKVKIVNVPKPSWLDLLQLGKKESIYLVAGVISSAFVGFSGMTLSYLFGSVLKIFVPSQGLKNNSHEDATAYSYNFIAAGTFFAAVAFLQSWFFTIAGESLIERLRTSTFRTIIKKEVAWFDREENKVGALCSRISTDTALVQGGTGLRMGLVCQAIATITICEFLTFFYHWKFGLLALGITSIMGLIIYCQSRVTTNIVNIENERSSEALSSEVIANIRTVVSLGREGYFYSAYAHSLQESHRVILGNIWKRAAIYALASSFPQFAYALSLYLGSTMAAGGLAFEKIITIGQGLRYGMTAISDALEFSPNFFEAKLAAHRVLLLINENQQKKTRNSMPELIEYKQSTTECDQLDFENVTFRYPMHPSNQALNQLSFSVKAGKTVALVGGSGSGKSTCIQLILRFYDPESGSIRVNSTVDARQLSIKSLRSNLGFVSQEPALFDKTIKENIAYGDNTREIQLEEIIEAARMANIHSFIQSLPLGYDTVVGSRGAQLSGGEKQRIAIARALIRKPKILLLDEATSALDNEGEKVVQLALDAARKGRTCITVAHRLSTVRNADCIVVMHKGRVQEQGTHEELMQLRGVYAKLVSADYQEH